MALDEGGFGAARQLVRGEYGSRPRVVRLSSVGLACSSNYNRCLFVSMEFRRQTAKNVLRRKYRVRALGTAESYHKTSSNHPESLSELVIASVEAIF